MKTKVYVLLFVVLFLLGTLTSVAITQDETPYPERTNTPVTTPEAESTPVSVIPVVVEIPVTDEPVVGVSALVIAIFAAFIAGGGFTVVTVGYIARNLQQNVGVIQTLERIVNSLPPEKRGAIYRLLLDADSVVELGKTVFDGIPTTNDTKTPIKDEKVLG